MKAYVRAGNAELGLEQHAKAAVMFKQALLLDANNNAAQVRDCLCLLICWAIRDDQLAAAIMVALMS